MTALIGFNVVAFLSCLVMVGGQVAAMSTLNFNSAELVVLGATIVCLWFLSGLGLVGTCKKHRMMLRMYAFMLLVLVRFNTEMKPEIKPEMKPEMKPEIKPLFDRE